MSSKITFTVGGFDKSVIPAEYTELFDAWLEKMGISDYPPAYGVMHNRDISNSACCLCSLASLELNILHEKIIGFLPTPSEKFSYLASHFKFKINKPSNSPTFATYGILKLAELNDAKVAHKDIARILRGETLTFSSSAQPSELLKYKEFEVIDEVKSPDYVFTFDIQSK